MNTQSSSTTQRWPSPLLVACLNERPRSVSLRDLSIFLSCPYQTMVAILAWWCQEYVQYILLCSHDIAAAFTPRDDQAPITSSSLAPLLCTWSSTGMRSSKWPDNSYKFKFSDKEKLYSIPCGKCSQTLVLTERWSQKRQSIPRLCQCRSGWIATFFKMVKDLM